MIYYIFCRCGRIRCSTRHNDSIKYRAKPAETILYNTINKIAMVYVLTVYR